MRYLFSKILVGCGFLLLGLITAMGVQGQTEPTPRKDLWTTHTRVFQDGNRFITDTTIQIQNFRENGVWEEIALDRLHIDDDEYIYQDVPFKLRIKRDGTRQFFPIRLDTTKSLTIGTPFIVSRPEIIGSTWTWDFVDGGRTKAHIIYDVFATGVKAEYILNEPLLVVGDILTLTIPFTANNLSISPIDNGIYDGDDLVATYLTPTVTGATGGFKTGTIDFIGNNAVIVLDVSGLTYPITIDPTIDVQIGAGFNDGTILNGTTYQPSGTSLTCGEGFGARNDCWFRFTGVSIPSNSNIDVAYITFNGTASSAGTPDIDLYGNDENDPEPIASATDYNNRSRTANTINIISPGIVGDYNTDSIVSIVQELVDTHIYNNDAMQFLLDNQLPGTASNRIAVVPFENNPAVSARLHIEYTLSPLPTPTPTLDEQIFAEIQGASLNILLFTYVMFFLGMVSLGFLGRIPAFSLLSIIPLFLAMLEINDMYMWIGGTLLIGAIFLLSAINLKGELD